MNGTFLDKQDVEYANYFLTIGGSLGPNTGSAHGMRAVSRAMERGMKLVVVDPRMSPEGAMADEWVPIRPGGDLAFTLSMLHVMLHEMPATDLDLRFIKERSNLPYLIGEDKLYLNDLASGKPLVWDPVDGKAKTFDDPTDRRLRSRRHLRDRRAGRKAGLRSPQGAHGRIHAGMAGAAHDHTARDRPAHRAGVRPRRLRSERPSRWTASNSPCVPP